MIDADELKEAMQEHTDYKGYLVCDPEEIIDLAPTVERPHGEWIEKPWGVVCSRCKAQALHTPNGNQSRSDYCPDCGASMRKEGKNEEE